ncbi:MAG: hypothetical protein JST91_14235 [Actinobacteria bacterium]|nr:hypothetical protein [Actinomycetota bacterium]
MSEHQSAVVAPDAGSSSRNGVLGSIGWLWVGIPFLYGLVQLILKIPALFTG